MLFRSRDICSCDTSRRTALRGLTAVGFATLWPSARACEYFSATLRVLHPWAHATPEGADSVRVSMRLDNVSRDDRLIGADTPVARTVALRDPTGEATSGLPIPAGEDTVLGEDGAQLLLLQLTQPLELGRSYPLKLVFEQGGTVNATLNIDFTPFRFR